MVAHPITLKWHSSILDVNYSSPSLFGEETHIRPRFGFLSLVRKSQKSQKSQKWLIKTWAELKLIAATDLRANYFNLVTNETELFLY
jgi:hypothetical protein